MHFFKNESPTCKQLSEFPSHNHFPHPIDHLVPRDHYARSRQQMIQTKPITTCEFIPMLQRCKPRTGWPRRLGMDPVCTINGDLTTVLLSHC